MRAPRELASERIGWTVKVNPYLSAGRTAARRQGLIKKAAKRKDTTGKYVLRSPAKKDREWRRKTPWPPGSDRREPSMV
jgi:hypothetical protein